MAGENISEALREARTICPKNNREIETIEIRQADAFFSKRTLELAVVVDLKGLITGSRTNIWTNSSNASAWNQIQATIESNVAIAPDGTLTADRINYVGDTANWDIVYQGTYPDIGGPRRWSGWLKTNDGSTKSIYITWAAPAGATNRREIIVTGVWTRYSVDVHPAGDNVHIGNQIGDTPAGWGPRSILIWGVQLESGNVMTDYIPTEGAPVTVPIINYKKIFDNFKLAMDGVYSDLREKYTIIRWALISLQGQTWTLETNTGFTSYVQFRKKLTLLNCVGSNSKDLIFGANYNFGASYKPGALDDIASRLNWSAGSDYVSKQILILADTPSEALVGSAPRVTFTTSCLSVYTGTGGQAYWYITCEDFPTFYPNEVILITGFTNPDNNGYYRIVTWSEATIQFENIDGSPLEITYEEFAEVTMTTVEMVNLSLPGNPEVVAAILEDKGIVVSHGPSFGDALLGEIVTTTGGSVIPSADLASEALIREHLVELLSSEMVSVPLVDPIYLVNDNRSLTALIETGEEIEFVRRNFAVNLFGSGEDGNRSVSVTIDNTDKEVLKFIGKIKLRRIPLEITFRTYLASDLSQPQNLRPLKLYMSNAVAKGSTISGEAKWINIQTAAFPNKTYSRWQFPSLTGSA
jgi:hypothetical protein